MIEQGRHLHLLRDGELIDAVITQIPPHPNERDCGCAVQLAYRNRKLTAVGLDSFDAMSALRGALAVDGVFLHVPRPRRLF